MGDVHSPSDVTIVGLPGFPVLADPTFYTVVGSLGLLLAVGAARRRIAERDPNR